MRNRIVIDGNMPAGVGGYYSFTPHEEYKLTADIEAGGDFIALPATIYFASADKIMRILVHELIHAGAHPFAIAPVSEEAIVDTVAAATVSEMGAKRVETGYQRLIDGFSQYLEGIDHMEILGDIVQDPKQTMRNLLQRLFVNENFKSKNWRKLTDDHLYYLLRKGMIGLKEYLPRIYNAAFSDLTDFFAETDYWFDANFALHTLFPNGEFPLTQMLVEKGMVYDFIHDICPEIFLPGYVNRLETLRQSLRKAGFMSMALELKTEESEFASSVYFLLNSLDANN